MDNTVIKTLMVDDRTELLSAYERLFSILGYPLTCISNVEEALDIIKNNGYCIVFVDFNLGSSSGIDLCYKIREVNKYISIFLISGSEIDSQYYQCADYVLIKPITLDMFKDSIKFGHKLCNERTKYG